MDTYILVSKTVIIVVSVMSYEVTYSLEKCWYPNVSVKGKETYSLITQKGVNYLAHIM